MRERRARGRERKLTRAEVESRGSLARRPDRPVVTRDPTTGARVREQGERQREKEHERPSRAVRPRAPRRAPPASEERKIEGEREGDGDRHPTRATRARAPR
jgi:hypothetical protein